MIASTCHKLRQNLDNLQAERDDNDDDDESGEQPSDVLAGGGADLDALIDRLTEATTAIERRLDQLKLIKVGISLTLYTPTTNKHVRFEGTCTVSECACAIVNTSFIRATQIDVFRCIFCVGAGRSKSRTTRFMVVVVPLVSLHGGDDTLHAVVEIYDLRSVGKAKHFQCER